MYTKLKTIITKNNILKDYISFSFWSTVGTVVSKLTLMLIWVMIARLLKPEIYGEFSLIKNTSYLFSEFIGLSLSIAATKFVAELSNDNLSLQKIINTLLVACTILGVTISVIFFSLSDFIAINMAKKSDLSQYISITSIVVLFSTINNCQIGILKGLLKFRLIVRLNFLQVVLSFPFFYYGTKYIGLLGAVWAYVFHYMVITAITQLHIRKHCNKNIIKINYKIDRIILKKIITYVLPYFAALLISYFASWYNEIILVSSSDSGFRQMGIYSAVSSIQSMIISGILVLCGPLVAMMSKYKKNSDFLDKLNYYIPFFLVMMLILPLLLIPEVIGLVYGTDYKGDGVYNLMWIITLYTPFIVIRHAIGRSVAVYEKQNIYLLDNILMGVIAVGGFISYSSYGIIAMVTAVGIANLLSILIFTPIYIKIKLLSHNIFNLKYMGIAMLLLLSVGSIYIILKDNFAIRITILITIYLILSLLIIRRFKSYLKNA